MPGPPLGPSYRTITTSPDWIPPSESRIPSQASSWLSNTLAGPENRKIDSSTPAVLMMQPLVAMLP